MSADHFFRRDRWTSESDAAGFFEIGFDFSFPASFFFGCGITQPRS
jgi:hypothetical protein